MVVALAAAGCGTRPTTEPLTSSDARTLEVAPKYRPSLEPKNTPQAEEKSEMVTIR
jgi:hypothetical protein